MEPYEQFVAGVKLDHKSNGTWFEVGPASHDWQSWWEPEPDWLPRNYPGDYSRAFIFTVASGGPLQNSGEALLVPPGVSGAWEIVILR